ncbi:MAG: hypothetical protein UZ11_BCD004000961 [Bacteroidetes bacterium OLB11]|nr:MAG: hypothetical protein UZ11_BCD004000961 [Bacteroidetes bacterium OLB11]
MKKTLLILIAIFCLNVINIHMLYAKPLVDESFSNSKVKTEKYISYIYEKIKFPQNGVLSFQAFRNAFYGYLNLVEDGKISRENILTVCDFTLSSNKKRLWVIDLKNNKVLFHSLVAHGMGTGEEYATVFSNIQDSHQSSLGFYITQETYTGNNGYSLKLNGVDGNFNNNAYERAIVIHGAEYVSARFAKDNKRLGRSHGCPALPVDIASQVIDKIKNGTCLFIYHTANNYLSKSKWINNPIRNLPRDADFMDLQVEEVKNNPRYIEPKNIAMNQPEEISEKITSKEKVISSVIYVEYNSRTGASDTCIVK